MMNQGIWVLILGVLILLFCGMSVRENYSFFQAAAAPWQQQSVRRFWPSGRAFGNYYTGGGSYSFPRTLRPWSGFGNIWTQLATPSQFLGRVGGRGGFGGRRW